MAGDGGISASDFDSYTATPPVAVKSSWWKPALMMLVVILTSTAMVLASLAVQRNREQDKEILAREQDRLRAQQVQACVQFNLTRRTTYESNRALAAIAIANSTTPNVVSPVVADFLAYNEDANDPVSCDVNDSNFMIDTSIPSIPPIPEYPL